MGERLTSPDFLFAGGVTGNVFFSYKRTHEDTYQNHGFKETHDDTTGDLNPIVEIMLTPCKDVKCDTKNKVIILPYMAEAK